LLDAVAATIRRACGTVDVATVDAFDEAAAELLHQIRGHGSDPPP